MWVISDSDKILQFIMKVRLSLESVLILVSFFYPLVSQERIFCTGQIPSFAQITN